MNLTFSGRISQSRQAVIAAFFINGALLATWVSRIPAIQTKLGLSEGSLGLLLLGISVGVLAALSLAGSLIARFGSRSVTLVGTVIMCVSLPLLTLIPSPVALWGALFIFGGAMSLMDVAMNEQAVWVERKEKRPLMSSFHAAFSIGTLTGALIGSGMASISALTPFMHFTIVSVVFGSIMLFLSSHLLSVKQETSEKKAVFSFPKRALWPLGAVAFSCAIAEGAMADWSAVYLSQVLNTSASFAALGFAAFSLTMTIGRLWGDKLSQRWSPAAIVRAGGVIATFGFVIAIAAPEPIIVLIGFAAIGLGLANIIPLSFSAAGNYPGISTGVGIAGVATIGYAGFLAGPPVIGLIAEQTSLRIALLIVTVLLASLVFTGKALAPSKNQINV